MLAVALAVAFAAVAASWTSALALQLQDPAGGAADAGEHVHAVLFTPSYAPQQLLSGFLQDVARWNPVSKVVVALRACFVGDVTWATTWPALVVVAGLSLAFGAFALREMSRTGV